MFRLLVLVLCFAANQAVWRPNSTTTFNWQLSGKIQTKNPAHVYDLDLFEVPTEIMTYLHGQGRKVVCYFSAGTFEHDGTGNSVRPDPVGFPDSVKGKTLKDWPNEQWLNIRTNEVKTVMTNRLKLARDKGCDGVEPDNVDGYSNDSGFNLQADDQLEYNKWLANEAHSYGLSVGLKNDVDQIEELEPYFDWALNEECVAYNECINYQPFINASKAVFHVEYINKRRDGPRKKSAVCKSKKRPRQLITLIKEWDLSAWFLAC